MEHTTSEGVTSIEKNFIQILSGLSPSDILVSKELETCFKGFLERGNTGDCLQLLPESLRTALSSPNRHNTIASDEILSSRFRSSNCPSSPESVLPSSQPSPHSNHPTTASSPCADAPTVVIQAQPSRLALGDDVTRHFETKGVEPTRARRLARLIRSFKDAKELDQESYSNLWRNNERDNERYGPELERTDLDEAKNGCIARLCLMLSANDVVHFALTKTARDLGLRKTRCRMTAALEKFSQATNISIESLKKDQRKNKNYLHLLRKKGPGSLLVLAPGSFSDWVTKASIDDIDLALEYRETHLPDLEKRAEALNGIGARTIVCGLLDHGWTSTDVITSPTPFLQLVRKHLDRNLEIPTSPDGSQSLDSPSQTDCNNDVRTVNKDFASSESDRFSGHLESKKRPFRTGRSSVKTCLRPADPVQKKRRNMHSSTLAGSGPSSKVASTQSREVAATEHSIDARSAGQESDSLVDEDWMRPSSGRLPGLEPSFQEELRGQDWTECLEDSGNIGPSFSEEEDDLVWMRLLDSSGDLPDPSSFGSRPATVDPNLLSAEAPDPDDLLRSDSYGLTNAHHNMDLFRSRQSGRNHG